MNLTLNTNKDINVSLNAQSINLNETGNSFRYRGHCIIHYY